MNTLNFQKDPGGVYGPYNSAIRNSQSHSILLKKGEHGITQIHSSQNRKEYFMRESCLQYCVEISNRFTALENIDAEVDINRAGENIRENTKISARVWFIMN
jgi:hypothetical protein